MDEVRSEAPQGARTPPAPCPRETLGRAVEEGWEAAGVEALLDRAARRPPR